MIQRLVNWYNSRRLEKAKKSVRFYERYSADLAHEIFDLEKDSPMLVSVYNSVQCSLKIEREKFSKLQQLCQGNIPVRQSS